MPNFHSTKLNDTKYNKNQIETFIVKNNKEKNENLLFTNKNDKKFKKFNNHINKSM